MKGSAPRKATMTAAGVVSAIQMTSGTYPQAPAACVGTQRQARNCRPHLQQGLVSQHAGVQNPRAAVTLEQTGKACRLLQPGMVSSRLES